MKRAIRRLPCALALAIPFAAATAQLAPGPATVPGAAPNTPASPSRSRITYSFSNAGLTPANWTIELSADGQGLYHSRPGEGSAPNAQGAAPDAFDQQIQISPAVRQQLFATAHARHFFAESCESSHKVAFTGRKTVAYAGPEGSGSCTFNWSQDQQLMKLAATFYAISNTLEEGRKLRLAYLHDRLGLDAELETLSTQARAGQAVELGNIAPELEAIASDAAVMRRAQARAAALLAAAKGDSSDLH